jgi:DNA-binding beta-propeller fold protein YncE
MAVMHRLIGMFTGTRNRYIATGILGLFVALGLAQAMVGKVAAQQGGGTQAPNFEVDPFWPKPLPNHWVLGSAIGVWADAQDNIWIIHRGSATLDDNEKALELKAGDCCAGAPPVLVFDKQGNLIKHWGGPGAGYDWPASNHGIFIDHDGLVWIGGNGPGDSHILKFTQDGKFVAQYGKPNARRQAAGTPQTTNQVAGYAATTGFVGGSRDPENFGRVAKIFVDPKANEAYIADGYLNKRVAVLDAKSGKMKRMWGAYGKPPSDENTGPYDPAAPPPQQFRNPVHCADLSVDGLVYVCDRVNDRIQVFKPDGTFVNETFLTKNTKGSGSAWDVAFSKDPQQRYLYVADGMNDRIYILQRDTMQVLASVGDGGRQPGQFYGVHSIATDSQGNIYTTETWEGKRLQKFVNKGLGPVTTMHRGTVWPQTATRP